MRILKFAAVGGVSSVLDLALAQALILADAPFWLAVAAGHTLGFINGYFWNSRLVFNSAGPGVAMRYLIVSIGSLALKEVLGHWFIYLGSTEMVAQVLAMGIGLFWNYTLSSRWAFAPRGGQVKKAPPAMQEEVAN